MIQLCFSGSRQLRRLRAYPRLERPPEMPGQLVAIFWNDSLSSCFLCVWSQGHSSWVNVHCVHFPATPWEEGPNRSIP